ncbi:OsmC family protein [Virgibacillus sp. YIM 98842]|uniref:OsmC family protein n=1 Tax=Virgibacillus sp. YIM 98842 TaxID=2663533 RepID=UPI0013DC2872|nr:OsmC family protein [Virgibacillus sp. YIM 98842]
MLQYNMNEHGFQTEAGFGSLPISGQGEHGYRPYEMLVSSIVGCSGLTLRVILEKMRLEFSDIHVTADVSRNPDIANRIEELQLVFTVTSENATGKKLEKALEMTIKNCGMIQSVKDSIKITESIKRK